MLLVSWRGSRVCSRLHKGTAFRPPRMRGRGRVSRLTNLSWSPGPPACAGEVDRSAEFGGTEGARPPHARARWPFSFVTGYKTSRSPRMRGRGAVPLCIRIQNPSPPACAGYDENLPPAGDFYPPAYKCRAASGPNATKWQLAGIRPAPRMRGRDGHPPQNSAEGLTPPPACAVAEESPAAGKLLPARLPMRRPPSGDSTRGFVTGYKTERPSRPTPPATTRDLCAGA